jgi:hypothetical protein
LPALRGAAPEALLLDLGGLGALRMRRACDVPESKVGDVRRFLHCNITQGDTAPDAMLRPAVCQLLVRIGSSKVGAGHPGRRPAPEARGTRCSTPGDP